VKTSDATIFVNKFQSRRFAPLRLELTRYEQRTTAKLLHHSYRPLNFSNRRILRFGGANPFVLDIYPASLIFCLSCCAKAGFAFVDLIPFAP
jgi:hypothetical protein